MKKRRFKFEVALLFYEHVIGPLLVRTLGFWIALLVAWLTEPSHSGH